MISRLRIPGKAINTGAKTEELAKEQYALPFSIDVQEIVDVTAARAAGETVTVDLEPPPADGKSRTAGQVCEVEFEEGITLWLRPGSLYRDFRAGEARGAAEAEAEGMWEIAPVQSRRSASRGEVTEHRIRRVTVYRWQRMAEPPPASPARGKARGLAGVAAGAALDATATVVAGKIAQPVGRAVEQHLLGNNKPGLYQIDLEKKADLSPATKLTAEGPILLFLHGTMSSFEGSFSGLWDSRNTDGMEVRQQFARRYSHGYAWEHYTLTESPIENALALARLLPDGAKLHLVSHSRGGLVGDLLCLGQRVEGNEPLSLTRLREIFELAAGGAKPETVTAVHRTQAAQLCELIEVLETKKVTVERFVRVACPARGTTLASGKLDRWLSVVKLLNDLVLPFNFPLQLLIAFIAEHDDPRHLPGLEAMMPGSPLVKILNFPELLVAADLSVISGDTEGKGLFGRLKELMLDQFFEDECDIVVNTGAMFGGLKRVDGGRFHLDSGQEVNHFSYFKNPETVRMLAAGLLRSDNSNGGFLPLTMAPEKEPARAMVRRRAPQEPLPVVFVLPGIMGSTLKSGDDRIWLGKLALMLGKFGKLAIERDVTPEEPFEEYYGHLIETLRETHEVIPFPYDWRRSILTAGESLALQVSATLDDIERRGSTQPVRILAHSMGGLVARAMIARKPEVWQRMTAHEGSRLIMLGTPNGGSYEIVRLLTGYASTLQQLALLDFTRDWSELLEIIVRFPGVLELLPIDNDFQYYRRDIWDLLKTKDDEMTGYHVQLPTAADLQQAHRTWETILAAPLDSKRTFYVAGQAKETPISWREEVLLDPEHITTPSKSIVFEATPRGDGRVPWESGIPLNVRTWFLPDVEHGDMPAHVEAFPAYLELLNTGSTERLSTTPPAAMRSAAIEKRTVLSREVPPILPNERELAGSVLGSKSPRRKKKSIPAPSTQVSITHGDISYALYPVCVGHYAGDTIVSAEDYLDKAMGGRLRERVLLGLYPGKLGTCEVVLNPKKCAKPAGAIVIGLGQVGQLSPGGLETAFTQAVLQYAVHVAECEDERFGAMCGVPRSARITTLLIGTGAGGITVRDSIEAILRGVAAANRIICVQGLSGKICIDAVEFMELWQDMAIQAAQDLEQVLLDGSLPETIVWNERQVNVGEGGRRRTQYEEPPNWWHRVEIAHDAKFNELRFTALTDRARAERSLVTGQLQLADDLIKRTIADTSRDTKTAHALFEMLLPNRLKELAPDQYDVVLVVDETSGRYPWELLEDRWSRGERPQAVLAGMLRQLKTDTFREQPVSTREDTVYVVGDPFLNGNAAEIFPQLEGARKEASAVADLLLQEGFAVTRQIRTDAQAILSGLHDNGYRILHLAGHGVHEHEIPIIQRKVVCEECEQPRPPQTQLVSGMVIGDNMFLTPGDVEQMRKVPELVFINCCHLGNLEPGQLPDDRRHLNRLAANIAAQFIRMGVKAVVAAGWAVDDAAAETFAISFYRHLLAGDNYGNSVRAAREETFSRHGTTNTWGAYQCYGDPGFRLRPPPIKKKTAGRRKYVLPAQAVTELQNLTNGIRMGNGSLHQLETVVQAIREADEGWLERADVAAALGLAYGELGVFDTAIDYLDRALQGEKADFPLLVVEQRANFKTRWAVELSRNAKKTASASPSPEDVIAEAIADMEMLMKFAPASDTAERLCLMGSAYKHRAMIHQGEERKESLTKMGEYYRKAHEKNYDKTRNKLNTYPLLNWLIADTLQEWCGEKSAVTATEIREWCESARSFAEERNRQKPDFWNSVVIPECYLLQALVEMDLPRQKERIISEYRQARIRGASPREFGSVIDHLKFLEEMMGSAKLKNKVQQTAALREIVAQLAPLAERDSCE